MNTHPPPVSSRGAPIQVPHRAPNGTGPANTARSSAASMCSCELDTESGPAGPILVLRVAGEIDMLTLPLLQHALAAAADQQPAFLVIDLAAVGFCCARGFDLLATTTQTHGSGYALSGLSRHLDRIAGLLWPDSTCVRYHSVAAAVTAIRVEQTYRLT